LAASQPAKLEEEEARRTGSAKEIDRIGKKDFIASRN